MALHSFDTPVKHRVRAQYREFLKRTVLREKNARDVRVLCLPGWEAIEIFDVYDRLKIPRQNIYAVEYNREAYDLLTARKLGINLWFGDVFDFLSSAGFHSLEQDGSLGGMTKFVTKGDRHVVTRYVSGDTVKELSFETTFDISADIPDTWKNLKFDIIALDICGHITGKVMAGVSSCFRGELLRDRGVFTLTSLASREQEMTKLLIRMATLMDAIIRSTITREAQDSRPDMVKAYGFREDEHSKMLQERTGLEAMIIFLAIGNELFFELTNIYNKALEGSLLLDMPTNNIFNCIMNVQFDVTAMVCRRIERLAYQSGHSSMRTAFMQFRDAQKTCQETGSLMEVISALMYGLGTKVEQVETPRPRELTREELMTKLRAGDIHGG